MKLSQLALAVALSLIGQQAVQANPDNTCQGQQLRKTFPSGALWDLCWSVRDKEGLTLSQAHYQAPGGVYRRVLGEGSLSQIEASFDDAAVEPMFVVTQRGLGGANARTLTAQDCPGGELKAQGERNLVCATTVHTGYLYKYTTQRQNSRFDITAVSQVGPRSYTIRWSLHENGTIEPAVGLSGILPAVGQSAAQFGWPVTANGAIATSFLDHYLWRLDLDFDTTAGNEIVEEITSVPSANRLRKTRAINAVPNEVGRRLDPETKRFWRVRDGAIRTGGQSTISYELVPAHYDQSRANPLNHAWLNEDVWFTQYNSCERHAADNPTSGNCGANLTQFASGEALNQKDVVVWFKQTNHFLPRSEDSNRIGTRWSGFQLLPRDWNAQNPF